MTNPRLMVFVAGLVVLAVAVYVFGSNQSVDIPAERGPELVSVTVPDLTPAGAAGKQKYDQFCAACHGDNAAGQEDVAPPFVHRIYESGHHGDVAFQIAARNGVQAHHWPFGNMPPVEGVTEQEVSAIITYVRELQRANGIN